ncbi:copper amine oxidase N-terminal domain-containing protein [Paenibacillus sp. P25]|nr:copper amine oxidase N-terminal domain-containing protein [Paenibacillus sp. P25]
MKRTKRVLLLTAAISGAFTAGVYAQDVLQRVDAYLRPDFSIVLDGKPVQLSGPALVYDDKSYLPLKELGNLLGASILWKADTKTIYINSRINPEQTPPASEQTYEDIELYNPYSVKVSYLGADYPLLLTYNNNGSTTIFITDCPTSSGWVSIPRASRRQRIV